MVAALSAVLISKHDCISFGLLKNTSRQESCDFEVNGTSEKCFHFSGYAGDIKVNFSSLAFTVDENINVACRRFLTSCD